jgi:hypothetical protein
MTVSLVFSPGLGFAGVGRTAMKSRKAMICFSSLSAHGKFILRAWFTLASATTLFCRLIKVTGGN